jgi:hypothetical protein
VDWRVRILSLAASAKVNLGADAVSQLEVAGYEIGLEVGEDYVGDTQALSGRIVDVLIDVPSWVDDGRLTADLVAD